MRAHDSLEVMPLKDVRGNFEAGSTHWFQTVNDNKNVRFSTPWTFAKTDCYFRFIIHVLHPLQVLQVVDAFKKLTDKEKHGVQKCGRL